MELPFKVKFVTAFATSHCSSFPVLELGILSEEHDEKAIESCSFLCIFFFTGVSGGPLFMHAFDVEGVDSLSTYIRFIELIGVKGFMD